MALTASNMLVIYRSGDEASEAIADDYISLHGLAADQKIAIPCSGSEILTDEATFNTQVLDPIKTAISTAETGGRNVYGLLLCYRVPGGYYEGSDIISSTSRLSRVHHDFTIKTTNPLYDRKSFKLIDEELSESGIVCSRIDGPTLEIAKKFLTNSERLKRQLLANGIFYIDPYSNIRTSGAKEYENAILDFRSRVLPQMNLEVFSSNFLNEYIDALIPRATNDSFVWSWFTPRGSPNFFDTSNALRIFGYNADYDGAQTIREVTDRRWTQLFLQANYVATAGSMSNPGNDGFLFPSPFFTTLLRGGTLGEAFLFSQPYLDWTIAVFGDPLAKVGFPIQSFVNESDTLSEINSWKLMFDNLARSIAYYIRKTNSLEENLNSIVTSSNLSVELDLLYPAHTLYNSFGDNQRKSTYKNIAESMISHVENRYLFVDIETPSPSFNDILSLTEKKISELVFDVQPNNNLVSSENVYPEGYWEIERTIEDDAGVFAFYHFELQISDKEDFSNILIDKKSLGNINSWSFEENPNEFSNLPSGGVPSRFVSRKIKYASSEGEYLERGEVYYFRLRQIDQLTNYPYRTWTDIIFT